MIYRNCIYHRVPGVLGESSRVETGFSIPLHHQSMYLHKFQLICECNWLIQRKRKVGAEKQVRVRHETQEVGRVSYSNHPSLDRQNRRRRHPPTPSILNRQITPALQRDSEIVPPTVYRYLDACDAITDRIAGRHGHLDVAEYRQKIVRRHLEPELKAPVREELI